MRRKIHIDRKMPDQKAIEKYKDFDSLLDKHQALTKRPRYNAIKVITGIVLIAIIGFLVLEAIEQEENAINPPLGKEYVEFEFHAIDPQVESTITLITGTSISIPANALRDSEGKAVNHIAYVKVSEFRNPIDFFLSGIPMTYDSAGVDYTFESAGMIQIEAFNEDGKLSLIDGKSMDISMVSVSERTFNVYEFDTTDNKWAFKGKDRIVQGEINESMEAPIISSDSMIISKIGNVPDGYSMDEAESIGMIRTDTIYPEYGSMYATPIQNPEKTREYANSIWRARKNAQRDMLNAFKKRDSTNRAYQKEMLRQQQVNDSMRVAFDQQMEKARETEARVFREFEINQFGIWNCDRPILAEMPDKVEVDFVLDGAGYKVIQNYYLTDLQLNAVYKFYPGLPQMTCDLASRNLVWMVKSEKEMLIVSREEFKMAADAKRPMKLEAMKTDEALAYLRKEMPSNLP